MLFKYKRRTYKYQDGAVYTEAGNLARDQESLLRVAKRTKANIEARGFHFGLAVPELEQYLTILTTEEKEELFHQIYEAYLYVGRLINENISQKEFSQCLSRMKRYELYLYTILGG